jgi:AcrR family transcriptional regulator
MAERRLPGRPSLRKLPLHGECGLRERKKLRTRQALADAALRLFAERGYEATTIADIAAAAEVSTRTFFSYFRSKDDVLFADTDERIAMIHTLVADRAPDEPPLALVRRVMASVLEGATPDILGEGPAVRLQILTANPELQGATLQRLLAAERVLAEQLQASYPELDEITAVAVSASVIGAVRAVAMRSLARGDSPQQLHAAVARALSLVEHGLAAADDG